MGKNCLAVLFQNYMCAVPCIIPLSAKLLNLHPQNHALHEIKFI